MLGNPQHPSRARDAELTFKKYDNQTYWHVVNPKLTPPRRGDTLCKSLRNYMPKSYPVKYYDMTPKLHYDHSYKQMQVCPECLKVLPMGPIIKAYLGDLIIEPWLK